MPVAGASVSKELETICSSVKCPNVTRWLNELYAFREQYNVYKTELIK